MTIFNPEHDLCMANGDANFVPPASALKFAADCASLVSWIEDVPDGEIVPWGWDAVLKRRLQKSGATDDKLPSDDAINNIRSLSHRRVAAEANAYINSHIASDVLRPDSEIVELCSVDDVQAAVESFGDAVAKSPWSGSGKGLRWLRAGELSASDLGWCRKVIERQGSVMLEKRHRIVQDFAMLFSVSADSVRLEGYSMFFNDNGIYKGNILASDDFIFSYLTDKYIDGGLLLQVREQLKKFLAQKFVGKYAGYLGVDMFIYADSTAEGQISVGSARSGFCKTSEPSSASVSHSADSHSETEAKSGRADNQGERPHADKRSETEAKSGEPKLKYCLAPCVEINVRMTMGLLARRLFDNHLAVNERLGGLCLIPPTGIRSGIPSVTSSESCPLKSTSSDTIDGQYVMATEYSPRPGELYDRFVKNGEGRYLLLTEITPETEYAVVVSAAE